MHPERDVFERSPEKPAYAAIERNDALRLRSLLTGILGLP